MVYPQKRVLLLRGFLTLEEQQAIVHEVLHCHQINSGASGVTDDGACIHERLDSSNSIKLNLGISCGGDLCGHTPVTVEICRRIFYEAWSSSSMLSSSLQPSAVDALRSMSETETALTGTALLYGINASMSAHYDSPTQPMQREEWLCTLSIGLSVLFRCDNEIVKLESGDVVVMDSMAVLHGVEKIVDSDDDSTWKRVGLLWPYRLGFIVWQGKTLSADNGDAPDCPDDSPLEGMDNLFQDDVD